MGWTVGWITGGQDAACQPFHAVRGTRFVTAAYHTFPISIIPRYQLFDGVSGMWWMLQPASRALPTSIPS